MQVGFFSSEEIHALELRDWRLSHSNLQHSPRLNTELESPKRATKVTRSLLIRVICFALQQRVLAQPFHIQRYPSISDWVAKWYQP